MAKVTVAEEWVNEYCGQSFTAGAAPDGVKFATLHLAKYLMDRQLLENGFIEEMVIKLPEILQICKVPLEKNKVSITYASSASDFDLRNLEG